MAKTARQLSTRKIYAALDKSLQMPTAQLDRVIMLLSKRYPGDAYLTVLKSERQRRLAV